MQTTYRALADGTLVAHVPLRFVRNNAGGRLYAREPGANMDRNQELPIVQMLAMGLKFRRMSASDDYTNRHRLARHLGVSTSYLPRTIRLAYLSPFIVEKIVNGELPQFTITDLKRIHSHVAAFTYLPLEF